MALVLHRDWHFAFTGGVMAIRVRGRKRSLSKKVSSFNMYDDQVYQIRATAFDALVKDAWLQKGQTNETMQNYYDMKTRDARAKANDLLEQFKKNVAPKPGQ